MWERWDSTWDDLETVPEDFLDAGDQVLVTVYYSARGRGSGIEYEERCSTSTRLAMASASANVSSGSDPTPPRRPDWISSWDRRLPREAAAPAGGRS